MAVVSIKYTGHKKTIKYKSVNVSYSNLKKSKTFDTGDFVKDWYDCRKFVIKDIENKEFITHSSSVDHFIMDGAPFESAYLHIIKDEGQLNYVDESDPNYIITQSAVFDNGIEFFVKKGTKPTWTELRIICNDPPKQNKIHIRK